MNELLNIALKEYGEKEIRGEKHNQRIIQYAADIGFGNSVLSDETAWCSIFINWCAQQAGLERSKKLNARSWLKTGWAVTSPGLGDIVIFWRDKPESWKGHVGIVVSIKKEKVYTLGGNQNNMVCIKSYPKNRVLEYRKLGAI